MKKPPDTSGGFVKHRGLVSKQLRDDLNFLMMLKPLLVSRLDQEGFVGHK